MEFQICLDPDSYVKWGLSYGMCINVLQTMGTSRHLDFAEQARNGEVISNLMKKLFNGQGHLLIFLYYFPQIFVCFCLTEIGHGSNTRGMRTTATYNKGTKEFILNSPDFEAAKCWAGNLGRTATHAIVYAQLITEGVHYGLHAFFVKIRDPETLQACEGLTVGDMGEKIGLNGVDNG